MARGRISFNDLIAETVRPVTSAVPVFRLPLFVTMPKLSPPLPNVIRVLIGLRVLTPSVPLIISLLVSLGPTRGVILRAT